MKVILYAFHNMKLSNVIRDGCAITLYMARLAKNQQVTMQRKLRVYFERNQSASFASQETRVNIKTVCKYYKEWSELISKACELDFLSRQRQDREQILLSYDNQLGHLYDTLETINYETKKYDRKGKEIPRHLISHKLQTINLIGSINERKGAFQLQVPADESLRKTVEEFAKKCQN